MPGKQTPTLNKCTHISSSDREGEGEERERGDFLHRFNRVDNIRAKRKGGGTGVGWGEVLLLFSIVNVSLFVCYLAQSISGRQNEA